MPSVLTREVVAWTFRSYTVTIKRVLWDQIKTLCQTVETSLTIPTKTLDLPIINICKPLTNQVLQSNHLMSNTPTTLWIHLRSKPQVEVRTDKIIFSYQELWDLLLWTEDKMAQMDKLTRIWQPSNKRSLKWITTNITSEVWEAWADLKIWHHQWQWASTRIIIRTAKEATTESYLRT